MEFQSELAGKKVFVTGGSGFIGQRLLTALVAAGAEVTALMRARRDVAGVSCVTGGLKDQELLFKHLKDCDILCHLAYDVRASAAENLDGFDSLIGAAGKAGVGRIVHLSSIVVYDDWPSSDLTEDSPMARAGGSPYRRAKIEMETRLISGTLPAAILQPTIVWGPGSALWTDALAEALTGGDVVLPKPEGVLNGVFVDDVIQAILRAAVLNDLGQERFIVSGPAGQSWSALVQGYADALGTGAVRFEAAADLSARLGPPLPEGEDAGPSAAARVSAMARQLIGRERFEALVRKAKRTLSKGGDFYPDHHLLEVYSAAGQCRTDLAAERLGYAPEFDLAKGMEITAPYLKSKLG